MKYLDENEFECGKSYEEVKNIILSLMEYNGLSFTTRKTYDDGSQIYDDLYERGLTDDDIIKGWRLISKEINNSPLSIFI